MGSDSEEMGGKASKDSISREDLEFLKANTTYGETAIKDFYKGFQQDCPNGKLDRVAFMRIYSDCFPGGKPNDFCDHAFRTFDTDNNGFIDFREFLLAIDVTSTGCPEDKLKWAFRMYDVDGNGWIDLCEMTTIVRSIYRMSGCLDKSSETADQRALDIFNKMDLNSDGKVTAEEFVNTCMNDRHLNDFLTSQKV